MRQRLPLPVSLRDALRSLRRSPLFAGMAVLSLGLALALNTTMFALVDAALHPAMPLDEPDRLFSVHFRGGERWRATPGWEQTVPALAERTRSFERVTHYEGAYGPVQVGTRQEDHVVARVPSDFFATLDVRPAVGRLFAANEPTSAVISHAVWRRWFAGRPLSEGLTLNVLGRVYTVVGVMPRGMHFPSSSEVWLPAGAAGPSERRWGVPVVRLRPGVALEAAQREVDLVAARFTAALSTREFAIVGRLTSVQPDPRRLRDFERTLSASVVVVLLIACANLATLLLARGVARRREVAIRMALGAGRARIVRAVLAETGLLALGGGALGVLLTIWALFILSTRAVVAVPELGDLQPIPSWRIFGFVLGAAAAAMLLCGAVPAARAAGVDPAEPMKDAGATTTARSREGHGVLVVLQVALSMSLVLGAAFLVANALRLRGFTFGYDARRLLIAGEYLLERDARDGAAVDAVYDEMLTRARALAGVREAATLRTEKPQGAYVLSEQGRAGERWVNLRGYEVVSPTYLRTLGIPVVQGRDFEPGDRIGTGAVIVGEETARRLWPDVPTPVGRMLKLGTRESKAPWVRVVGVARRVELFAREDPDLPPEPVVYHLPARDGGRSRDIVVRTERRDDAVLAIRLRQTLGAATPGSLEPRVRPWLAGHEARVGFTTFLAWLFVTFGAFALALCAVGLYGVLAYAVSRRLREFAVRVALGARGRDVARLVLRHAAVLTLAGVGVGALVALGALAVFAGGVFDSRWTAVRALLIAELVVFAVAALASAPPTRRAARADPLEIMRST